MSVSLIIPALNESALVETAVVRGRACGADEVIVVDGGSDDDTVQRAQSAGGQVLQSPAGRARQLNQGASRAASDVLLFVHADNWLPEGAARQIGTALAFDHTVGGAFQQRIEAAGRLYRWLEWGNARRIRWWQLPYGDQGIFVRREVFERLGGFPDVPLLEDLLFARRLRQEGHVALLPGPLSVSARRWQQQGVVRQTLRNWCILAAHRLGASPERLAPYYRRHAP